MPAASERIVRVEGLRELQRAFAVADKQISRDLRKSLRDAAEPVRSDAESRASSAIPRIGLPWSRMRVGVTRHSVYVAPRERGVRRGSRRRPNLAGLLLERAMEPALEANHPRVLAAVEDLLQDMGRHWERV